MATTLFNFGALRRQTRTRRHAMGLHQPRRHSSCAACFWLLLMLVTPSAVQAQFSYTTNNGAITLTSYSGAGGVVVIPDFVTSIGDRAFYHCSSLTNVTIPDSVTSIGHSVFDLCTNLANVEIGNSVTSIGDSAFYQCCHLTNVTIPNSVTNIRAYAFYQCSGLTSVKIGNNVTSIEGGAFWFCSSLTNVTIPDRVTSIGEEAFACCYGLKRVYISGNAPLLESPSLFTLDSWATVYYLPGTTNWGSTYGGRPALLWNPVIQTSAPSFGVQTNQFGFTITGTANIPIVIEGCMNLAEGVWVPRESLSLTNGSYCFSDAEWRNYPNCLYRIRSP